MNCHSDSKDFIFAWKKRNGVGEEGREGRKKGRKREGGGRKRVEEVSFSTTSE